LQFINKAYVPDNQPTDRPTNQPNPQSEVPLEKRAVTEVVKEFPVFMEPEVPLPCSQEPATGPYPELDESSPHILILPSKDPFQYYLPSTPRTSKLFFPSGFPTKILYAFISLCMIHATPTSSSLIWSP